MYAEFEWVEILFISNLGPAFDSNLKLEVKITG